VLVVSTVVPALAGTAITGHQRGLVIAAALLLGGIAAGVPGTTAMKRDLNDPALRRMLGVDVAPALAARAVLPVLLSMAWLGLALTLLVTGGVLSGWLWPLAGLAAGPGMAAAVLRMGRTAPIDPAEPGRDTPMGTIYPWQLIRVLSLILGIVGGYPVLLAVKHGQVFGKTLAEQILFSAVILGGYLLISARQAP
jgi:hypothetical protein